MILANRNLNFIETDELIRTKKESVNGQGVKVYFDDRIISKSGNSAELTECAFANCLWSGVGFADTDFSHSEFPNNKFANCLFRNCTFSDTSFIDAEMWDCTFENCNFSRAIMSDAYVQRSHFTNCNFYGVYMQGFAYGSVSFSQSNLQILGTDPRGYLFYMFSSPDGRGNLRAGCRWMMDSNAAYTHWSGRHLSDLALHRFIMATVEYSKAIAKIRGWEY